MYPNETNQVDVSRSEGRLTLGGAGAMQRPISPPPQARSKESRFQQIHNGALSLADQLQTLAARLHGIADSLGGQEPKAETEAGQPNIPHSNFAAQVEENLRRCDRLLRDCFYAVNRLESL